MATQATAAGVLPCPPSSYETPGSDPVRYRVEIISPSMYDWSLRQLASDAYRDRLGAVLAAGPLGTEIVAYAPTVMHMSARVLGCNFFTEETELPGGVSLLRPTVPCDGLPVPEYAKVVMSTGGCALVVLTGRAHGMPVCIAAHAGLDSVIDPYRLHREGQPRPDASVIGAMLGRAMLSPMTLTLRVFYTLPWQGLPRWSEDPTHGDKNRRLLQHLADFYPDDVVQVVDGVEHVDLARLICHQTSQAGIGVIEALPEYQLPVGGRFAYTTNPQLGLGGQVRNLVVLTRW